ncbi:hypothetical protein HIM_05734 [Hirsutella minnesotensis 3608]|uniref:Peptidase S8/S53 domain-containing protein n=1 Tax=Hirsutella minnesotensis 3608 TaxID=1043627 RepID=A0A0F7ZP38_9HYPO|nr:hypothetical protein HIM_05734 [Hirsutella minnesotensis 3608]
MKPTRAFVGFLLSSCVASALPSTSSNSEPTRPDSLPILNQNANQTVPNRYLVAFKSNVGNDIIDAKVAEIVAKTKKSNLGKRSLDGRALSLDPFPFQIDGETRGIILDADDATIQALSKAEYVASIEADLKGSADSIVSQANAPGNLVRLSHNQISGSSTYDYDDSAGQGITVYVLDGGVRLTHQEFGGRATFGARFSADESENDNDGHGTHVAGLVGGATYGVAKKVQLVAVKLDVEASQMLKALDFVLADVQKKKIQGKAVISMSMHVDGSDIVDKKFKHLVDSGVVCVVSAGNTNDDAGQYSPGREPSVITVGAMNHANDFYWENSAYGPAVDIWAPGFSVQSSYHYSDTSTRYLSGTTTPQVAGLAAYIMALENITQPAQVMSRLKALAEQSGAQVLYNAPNTTGLIASNGLDKTPLSASRPLAKMPWITEDMTSNFWDCGFFAYSENNCGSQVYCDAFDSDPKVKKRGFFKNAQECFDAHEPAPKLRWQEQPPQKPRPASCGDNVISDECPQVCGQRGEYDEGSCGTQAYCEAFDKIKPRPYSLRGFKNTEACLQAHEPRPVAATGAAPAA